MRAGWKIHFVTVGLSPISRLKNDFRFRIAQQRGFNHPIQVDNNLHVYYWMQAFCPHNLKLKWLNDLSSGLFRMYSALPVTGLHEILKSSDRIFIESCPALAFVPRIRHLAPQASLIYRMSDDLSVMGAHPVMAHFERAAIPWFDMISVPSPMMRFRFPNNSPVFVHLHGLEKAMLDVRHPDPYPNNGRRRVVAMGATLFDEVTFLAFAEACPDVDFHMFGAVPPLPARPNIFFHGELAFKDLLPFIQHADVGFAPYKLTQGCEYLAHTSNKIMQFTWMRLPILVPCSVPAEGNNIILYELDNYTNYPSNMAQALAIDKTEIDVSYIKSWDEMLSLLEKDLKLVEDGTGQFNYPGTGVR